MKPEFSVDDRVRLLDWNVRRLIESIEDLDAADPAAVQRAAAAPAEFRLAAEQLRSAWGADIPMRSRLPVAPAAESADATTLGSDSEADPTAIAQLASRSERRRASVRSRLINVVLGAVVVVSALAAGLMVAARGSASADDPAVTAVPVPQSCESLQALAVEEKRWIDEALKRYTEALTLALRQQSDDAAAKIVPAADAMRRFGAANATLRTTAETCLLNLRDHRATTSHE